MARVKARTLPQSAIPAIEKRIEKISRAEMLNVEKSV